VKDQATALYWMKQSYLMMTQNNWMGVFMDMSKASLSMEHTEKSCNFHKMWRRSHLEALEDGEMYIKDIQNFDQKVPDFVKLPQNVNNT